MFENPFDEKLFSMPLDHSREHYDIQFPFETHQEKYVHEKIFIRFHGNHLTYLAKLNTSTKSRDRGKLNTTVNQLGAFITLLFYPSKLFYSPGGL